MNEILCRSQNSISRLIFPLYLLISSFSRLQTSQKKNRRRKRKKQRGKAEKKTYEHFEFLSWQFSDGFNFKHVLIQFVVISKIYMECLCLCMFCAFWLRIWLQHSLHRFVSLTFTLPLPLVRLLAGSLFVCAFFSFIFHSKTLPHTHTQSLSLSFNSIYPHIKCDVTKVFARKIQFKIQFIFSFSGINKIYLNSSLSIKCACVRV